MHIRCVFHYFPDPLLRADLVPFASDHVIIYFSEPFFEKPKQSHVKSVFESLESKGFGRMIIAERNLFFRINPKQLEKRHTELALTRNEVAKALCKQPRYPEKFEYLLDGKCRMGKKGRGEGKGEGAVSSSKDGTDRPIDRWTDRRTDGCTRL